jgi:ATP-dependent DNA helicase PIF1
MGALDIAPSSSSRSSNDEKDENERDSNDSVSSFSLSLLQSNDVAECDVSLQKKRRRDRIDTLKREKDEKEDGDATESDSSDDDVIMISDSDSQMNRDDDAFVNSSSSSSSYSLGVDRSLLNVDPLSDESALQRIDVGVDPDLMIVPEQRTMRKDKERVDDSVFERQRSRSQMLSLVKLERRANAIDVDDDNSNNGDNEVNATTDARWHGIDERVQDVGQVLCRLRDNLFDAEAAPERAQKQGNEAATPLFDSVKLFDRVLRHYNGKPMRGNRRAVDQQRMMPIFDALQAGMSAGQARVLLAALFGRSMFFTGCAGTGKSFLLERIVSGLQQLHGKGTVAVCASTGIAAVNVGGSTLHKFVGLGLCQFSRTALARVLKSKMGKAKARRPQDLAWVNRWRRTETLVVDEVSMLNVDFFEAVEYIARVIREQPSVPFGGMQVILCGDFTQLPPVIKDHDQLAAANIYLFRSARWDECLDEVHVLQHIFRQSDPEFVALLNETRRGQLSNNSKRLLCKRLYASKQPVRLPFGIRPTVLYPHRNKVEAENVSELRKLLGKLWTRNAVDSGRNQADVKLLKDCTFPLTLQLKVGAQVVHLANVEPLCNGSRGIVIDFVRFTEEPSSSSSSSSSSSASSSEGSRVRVNARGQVEEIDDGSMFHRSYSGGSSGGIGGDGSNDGHHVSAAFEMMVPLVRFADGFTKAVGPEKQTIEIDGREVASRSQVPLALAYALTIHKSQGMTLDYITTDLRQCFSSGQAYVALSRCRTFEGIRLLGYDPKRIFADPEVLAYYDSIINK